MREIKFKVWDKPKKKMFIPDGFYFDSHGNITDILCYGGHSGVGYDRFIVMQFTGLHDKNGKEIYEGDILEQAVPLSDRYIDKGLVEFSKGCFIIKTNSTGEHQIVSDWIRIIGNIHENPELLKGA